MSPHTKFMMWKFQMDALLVIAYLIWRLDSNSQHEPLHGGVERLSERYNKFCERVQKESP